MLLALCCFFSYPKTQQLSHGDATAVYDRPIRHEPLLIKLSIFARDNRPPALELMYRNSQHINVQSRNDIARGRSLNLVRQVKKMDYSLLRKLAHIDLMLKTTSEERCTQ